jgi:multimeric flavodoxin WrbA
MNKFLFISGSPRKGNTEYILNKVFDSVEGEKELILLREKNIKHCLGCLSCGATKKCAINDDMTDIYGKIENADVIVLGTPNYYDNVSGLFKDFIDRTNPFYETGKLKGKKVVAVVVGGGETEVTKFVTDQIMKNFTEAHEMDLIDSYCFKALGANEIENNPEAIGQINKIIERIKKLEAVA